MLYRIKLKDLIAIRGRISNAARVRPNRANYDIRFDIINGKIVGFASASSELFEDSWVELDRHLRLMNVGDGHAVDLDGDRLSMLLGEKYKDILNIQSS